MTPLSTVDAAAVPRFARLPSFMRLPVHHDPSLVDIALVGVPSDGCAANRAGARHGPRDMEEVIDRGIEEVMSVARAAQRAPRLLRGCRIAGADVVEVSSPFDPSGLTAFTGATMMFELLCAIAGGERI